MRGKYLQIPSLPQPASFCKLPSDANHATVPSLDDERLAVSAAAVFLLKLTEPRQSTLVIRRRLFRRRRPVY